jgi:hypothetical protein
LDLRVRPDNNPGPPRRHDLIIHMEVAEKRGGGGWG